MRSLWMMLIGLCCQCTVAAQASDPGILLAQLAQPVAVAMNDAGQSAVLDLQGLHLNGVKVSGVESSVLDVFSYQRDWWLADPRAAVLQRVDAMGRLQQTLSAKGLLPATSEGEASPATPEPVAVAVRQDVLYWADRANHRICRYDLLKQQPLNCFGKRGEGDGEFQYPYQMRFDRDGYLYVTDILNARLQMFDANGRFFSTIGHFGSGDKQLFRPNGLAIDVNSDHVYVSDSYFGHIQVFKAGEALGPLRDANGKVLIFQSPTGLAWHDGQLMVAETTGGQVSRVRIDASAQAISFDSGDEQVEPSQKNCVMCHLSWAKQGNAPDAQGLPPESSERMCYSCHNGAVMDSRLRIGQGAQHASVYDDAKRKAKRHQRERKDKLPEIFPRTVDKELPCTSCHTPHTQGEGNDTLYQGHHNAWLRTPNKGGDLCERCHESKTQHARETEAKQRGLNHPLAMKLAEPPAQNTPGYAHEKNLQTGLSDKLKTVGSALGHQKELICQSCHQIHGGHGEEALTALKNDKGQLCASCHERQFSISKDDARHKGVHPVNIKPEKPMKRHDKEVTFVSCETCHKVHDGKLGTPLLEKDLKDLESLCESCHQRQHAKDKDDAQHKGIHPVNIEMENEVEIAGVKTKTVTCLTCHAVHKGKPNTPALVEDHKDGQLCAHCHVGKQAIVGSDHDLRVTAAKKPNQFKELPSAGVCSACHSLHRAENQGPHLAAAKTLPEDHANVDADHSDLREDRLCLNCHQKGGIAEDKAIEYFAHPHQDLILRSDKKQMPLLGKQENVEEFGRIACVTCHDPHFWTPDLLTQSQQSSPTIQPVGHPNNVEGTPVNSFLRTLGVNGRFCVDCHGLEALSKFKYYHDKSLVRSRGVDYLQ